MTLSTIDTTIKDPKGSDLWRDEVFSEALAAVLAAGTMLFLERASELQHTCFFGELNAGNKEQLFKEVAKSSAVIPACLAACKAVEEELFSQFAYAGERS